MAHSSAFTSQWSLKLGLPLQFPWAVTKVALSNLCHTVGV